MVTSHVNGWKYGCYRKTACRRYAINIGGIPKGTHSMAAIYPAMSMAGNKDAIERQRAVGTQHICIFAFFNFLIF